MVRKNPSADLRAPYRKTLEAALAIALALMIAAFKFFPDIQRPNAIEEMPPDPIIGENVPVTEQFRRPPPPVRPPIVIESPDAEALTDLPIDTDLRIDISVPPPPDRGGEEDYFEAVEELPHPVGGYSALMRNLTYPDLARRVGIEGTVVVVAYVDESGTVTRTELMKGIGFGCDESALSAVQNTAFQPGLQRGKPVKVKLKIPVRFRLYN